METNILVELLVILYVEQSLSNIMEYLLLGVTSRHIIIIR